MVLMPAGRHLLRCARRCNEQLAADPAWTRADGSHRSSAFARFWPRHHRRWRSSTTAPDRARYDTGEPDPVNIAIRTLGDMTRSSTSPRWAYLLFRLIRELRPESVLEMGSCVGISACYQAAALELNGAGKLLTLEGAPVLAARTARSIEELRAHPSRLGHRRPVPRHLGRCLTGAEADRDGVHRR